LSGASIKTNLPYGFAKVTILNEPYRVIILNKIYQKNNQKQGEHPCGIGKSLYMPSNLIISGPFFVLAANGGF